MREVRRTRNNILAIIPYVIWTGNGTNNTHGSTTSDSGTEKQPNNVNRTEIIDKNMATTTKIESVNDDYDNGKTYPTMSITESISSDGTGSEKVQDNLRATETSASDTGVSGDGKLMTSTQPMSGTDNYYSVSPGMTTNTDSEATNETIDLITNLSDISNTTTTDFGLITAITDSTTDNETTNNTELIDTVSVPESVPELTTVISDTTMGSTDSTIDPDLTSDESTIATTLFNNTTTTDTLTNATMTETDVVTTGIDNATIGPELTTDPELFDNSTTKLINSSTTDPELNTTTKQIDNATASMVTTSNPTTSTLSMSTVTDLEKSTTTVTESTAVTIAVHVTVPELVDTTTIAESTGFTTTESMDNSTTVTVSGLDTNMTTKSGIQIINIISVSDNNRSFSSWVSFFRGHFCI